MANILDDAEIIDIEKIDEILKVQPQPFEFISETKPKLAEWGIGMACKEDSTSRDQDLGRKLFRKKLSHAQIANFKSNHPGDAWNISFDILVQWNRRNKNSRQVFFKIFLYCIFW